MTVKSTGSKRVADTTEQLQEEEEVKHLYSQNHKILMKRNCRQHSGQDILSLWTRRTNIVKRATLHRAIYRVSATPIKIPIPSFTELIFLRFFKIWTIFKVSINLLKYCYFFFLNPLFIGCKAYGI